MAGLSEEHDVVIGAPDESNTDNIGPEIEGQERATVDRAMKLFRRAVSAREPVSRHWSRYYRLWATRQWDDLHVDDWKSQPQVNFIFSTIELETSTMTDQDPQAVVFPRQNSEESLMVADALNKLFDDSWDKTGGRLVLKDAVRNSKKYGTGIVKTGWSTGRDNVELVSVPPDQFYPDPAATGIEDMWYCFHVYEVSINDIIENWPDRVEGLTKKRLENLGQFERNAWSSRERFIEPFGGRGKLTFTEGTSTFSTQVEIKRREQGEVEDGTVTLVEFWEKSPDDRTIRLHYISGNELLDTLVNPLGSKIKEFPFARFINVPVEGKFWGQSAIQPLEPMQLSINRRRQQIVDYLDILGNPPILADRSAGLEEDIFLGAPGELLTVEDGARVTWFEAPPLPSGLFAVQNLDKSEFETISGMFDVVQGRTPTGIEAAAAIAELQEAAQVRIRDKVALMESSIERLGNLMLLLVQSNYTEERALMVLGKEDSLEEVRVNVPLDTGALQEVVDQEIDKGLDITTVQRALDLTEGEFFIEIKAGSTLPVSKMARLNEALMLFDRGLIDQEEVLLAILHPRRREIIERMAPPELDIGAEAAQLGGAPISPTEQISPAGQNFQGF